MCLPLALLPALAAPQQDRVASLPGWDKPLPSPMYSGFLSIPGSQKQLHYLPVEAEPPLDPHVTREWLYGLSARPLA